MEPETNNNKIMAVLLCCAVALITATVFAFGWWRFGSVWMGLASVLAEIAIVAIPFAFGLIPK